MSDSLIDAGAAFAAIPIHLLDTHGLAALKPRLNERQRAWVEAADFKARSGALVLVPDDAGRIERVLFGIESKDEGADPMVAGRLPDMLPPGDYRFADKVEGTALAAIYFALGAYRFGRYRKSERPSVRLMLPEWEDAGEIHRIVDAIVMARDLINTPANDLGPAELAAAIKELGARHGAAVSVIEGAALAEGFPMVHAVGAAATEARQPLLVDLVWGNPAHPRITLVGKGVCFDTGGLDIKPSSAMLTMKKDMGGAANLIALAHVIMDAKLPVRLRLLVPTVENAIASEAFRPGDVLRTRKGLTVEIGNTDAEGRLILGDALTYAFEEDPRLVIDMATLTGAARVALGPDLPVIFTDSDELAAELAAHGVKVRDPVWRLPLYRPYFAMLESKVSDINNAGNAPFAGAITAALFLSKFVDPQRWIHIDVFAWNATAKPGRAVGGEVQGVRALYELVKGIARG